MPFKQFVFVLSLILNTISGTFAQLRDCRTKQPVPYASVFNKSNGQSTEADSLGSFSLNATPTDSIWVSHINYEPKTVVYQQLLQPGFCLQPKERTLPEAVVMKGDFINRKVEVVRRVYHKMMWPLVYKYEYAQLVDHPEVMGKDLVSIQIPIKNRFQFDNRGFLEVNIISIGPDGRIVEVYNQTPLLLSFTKRLAAVTLESSVRLPAKPFYISFKRVIPNGNFVLGSKAHPTIISINPFFEATTVEAEDISHAWVRHKADYKFIKEHPSRDFHAMFQFTIRERK